MSSPALPVLRPGPDNALTDVAGIRVGHHTMTGAGELTGSTVILAPDGGMTAGIDVRGGSPGTRETDLLHPGAPMERIHAVVLTGGSAYGLDAASGVMQVLAERHVGFAVGDAPGQVVPIIPAAVLFDLGRGGDFRAHPGADAGRAAVLAARESGQPEQGNVGAGTGAAAGRVKGGLGTASVVLPGGATVAALVAVNAMGSVIDPATGALSAAGVLLPGDADRLRTPSGAELAAVQAVAAPREPSLTAPVQTQSVQNTTIGVIATDAVLTKAQCTKLAGLGHNGLARSIHPVHTLFDGDTVFGLSTNAREVDGPLELHEILCAATDVMARAVLRAILAAGSVTTTAGSWPGYRDLAPSSESTP